MLYRAKAVARRPQRLRVPKRPTAPSQIFKPTYCAGRWQSTSWLCYCLIKSRTEVPETITQSALRRMWIVRNIPEYARPAACLGCNSLVFRFSERRYSPIQIFSAKLSVEIQRVLLYYVKRIFTGGKENG